MENKKKMMIGGGVLLASLVSVYFAWNFYSSRKSPSVDTNVPTSDDGSSEPKNEKIKNN